jgi:hypothetical protein
LGARFRRTTSTGYACYASGTRGFMCGILINFFPTNVEFSQAAKRAGNTCRAYCDIEKKVVFGYEARRGVDKFAKERNL